MRHQAFTTMMVTIGAYPGSIACVYEGAALNRKTMSSRG